MLDFLFAIIAVSAQSLSAPDSGPAEVAEAPTAQVATAETPATGAPSPSTAAEAPATVTIAPQSVVIGQGVLIEGTPAAAPAAAPEQSVASEDVVTADFNMAVLPAGLVAEPQVPSGKFTTAVEVKPILNATKANWVAVRDFNGQDLLYVTHLFSWRCGLAAMALSVNNEPMQNWPLPACHTEYSTPNALLDTDTLPYLTLKQGAVQTITIQIVYDDLSMDIASFARGDVLIP
jgi:hypothetical protein